MFEKAKLIFRVTRRKFNDAFGGGTFARNIPWTDFDIQSINKEASRYIDYDNLKIKRGPYRNGYYELKVSGISPNNAQKIMNKLFWS